VDEEPGERNSRSGLLHGQAFYSEKKELFEIADETALANEETQI
jgi:hypothetical protein